MPTTDESLEPRVAALEDRCASIENDVGAIVSEIKNLEAALAQAKIKDIPAIEDALGNLDQRVRRLGG
jgi:multidrug resistance efflux pump